MEVKREHFRAMIFYDFRSGLDVHQCFERLTEAFPDSAPSLATISYWFREFRRGRDSLEDGSRPGRPEDVVTDEMVDRVKTLITKDRHCTYVEIQRTLNVSSASVHKILHEKLEVRKLTSRWIPHLLNAEQKQARVDWCRDMLRRFENGTSRAVSNIITGDETWISSYEPETKRQSQVWVFPDEECPTKVVRGRSTKKKMVATFVRRSGHVATIALEDQRTVTAEWYTGTCLPVVFEKLREQRPRTGLSGLFLHQDNASSHTARQTSTFLEQQSMRVLPHPPYSPDLAPCDFFVFPKVKYALRGKRFDTPEDAVDAYRDVLDGVTPSEWCSCFEKWFERMRMCVQSHGVYFEKI